MSDEPHPPEADSPDPPAFDKQAARQRYRATMRSPQMRVLYTLLALVILISWGLGVAAVFAKDVEGLPGHDLGVLPRQCLACHTQRLDSAPPIPHIAFPTCGFCHRQSPPTPAR
jgi:hypothetical protein